MNVEWFTRKQFTVGIIEGTLRIWLGLFNLTWTLWRDASPKQFLLFWCQDHLSISLGGHPRDISINDPWWWRIRIAPLDILLGKAEERRRHISVEDAIIPMLEGSYPAKVATWEYIYTRPRWFTRTIVQTEIVVPGGRGVPVPTPWGEDIQSGVLVPGDTAKALAYFILYVLRMRKTHGGSYLWRPLTVQVFEPDAPQRGGRPKGFR